MIVSFGDGQGQLHVADRDAADAGVQQPDADFLVLELLEFLADRFDRAAEVGLQDHLQLGDLGCGRGFPASSACQRDHRLALLPAGLALLGDFAGRGEIGDDVERVVGVRARRRDR